MRDYIIIIGYILYIIGLSQIVNLGGHTSKWQLIGIFLIQIGVFLLGYWLGLNEATL